ncbi:MAG: molybdopterin molybdotransferase MoeA [Nitratireductor sp.]|nr:molybdopterin molybdotransferase MoeA [Nitratireductor sp.]
MMIAQRADHGSCGCETPPDPSSLVSIDEALRCVLKIAAPIDGTDTAPPSSVTGRILAKPVRAVAMTPPFDNAAMDGYAVDSTALTGAPPWRLSVVGRVAAGETSAGQVVGQTAARIFTGAPVPPGADAVVKQENVVRDGATVILDQRPLPGLNVRRAGDDMRFGEIVLQDGVRLGAREIAACAGAGAARVHIRRAVRIGLLVTGSEIRQTGASREAAHIWDVNTPMLCSELARPDVDLVRVTQGLDDRTELRSCLADMAETVDLIVTTGGISVGEEDHVKPVLKALGAEIHVNGVAIKPGKPVCFGRLGKAVWLGLPGNPQSAFITWNVFGLPLLDVLSGRLRGTRKRHHVVTGKEICRKPGRCEIRPARIVGFDGQGREIVVFDDAASSAHVARLPCADGLILIPAETEHLPEGALIEFQPFHQT